MLTLLASGGGGLLDTLGVSPPVVLVQILIFVTTFAVLKNGLFGRVLHRMQTREAEMQASQDAVAKDQAELKVRMKEYEERLAKSDREAYERAQATVAEGLAQAQALVAKAAAQASAEVQQAAAELAKRREEARPKIHAEVSRLALEMAAKAVGAPPGEPAKAAVERWLAGRVR
jgi:F0F1-type ATP synthase membrane subunit b/b'